MNSKANSHRKLNYRNGNERDLPKLKELGVRSWSHYKADLTNENWNKLYSIISNVDTYANLLNKSECLICETGEKNLIGMAFLVPNGNPNEIYHESWCHLRFVSVNPAFAGYKIGETLTRKCIDLALVNNEQTMALHTSEIMKGARHIYEKVGFKIRQEIEPSLGVRYWLYTLELSSLKVEDNFLK